MNNNKSFNDDPRYKQCNKEALVTVGIFIANIILIGVIPMLIGYNVPGDQVNIILGFPDWFFYGCIVGLIALSLLIILVVKIFFKDMDLD